jgi:NAD(P)H-hydrate epimerase
MFNIKSVPAITSVQMIEVDRRMIEAYGISLVQMMENAGRNLADLTRQLLGGMVSGRQIAVLSGPGNNGGGGMVAARHLHNWGAGVQVFLVGDPNRLKEDPALQWRILEAYGLATQQEPDIHMVDLIIDALIGYGLEGKVRQPFEVWIDRVNNAGRQVLSLDTPSGLDVNTGQPGTACVQASATLTLALPKTGLLAEQARPYVGQLYLADIGVPPKLYQDLGWDIPGLFDKATVIPLGE